jgi:hypothetical protein
MVKYNVSNLFFRSVTPEKGYESLGALAYLYPKVMLLRQH